MGATNFFTHTVSEGTFSVSASDSVLRMSVICRGGTITFRGDRIVQGITSQDIDLEEGQGVTVVASGVSNPIDGVTVTAPTSSDIAEIIMTVS
jgi:hypothetical protein